MSGLASARRARLVRLVALPVTAAVACTACQGGAGEAGESDADKPAKPAAEIVIEPRDGSDAARPDKPITVQVTNGTIRSVSVESGSDSQVEGRLDDDRRTWTSRWTMHPDSEYAVTATAVDAEGRTSTATSGFVTLQPDRTVATRVAPLDGETVGVGMPIMVLFTEPIENRANVESALEVRMSEPVEGAWHWISDEQVQFRPREYWPVGQEVTLVSHLAGVRAGDGLYGEKNQVVDFEVGERHVSVVDADDHHMVVERGGEVVREFDVSLGKPGFETRSGIHIAQEKAETVVMDSATIGRPGEYRVTTDWNVRISYSGEFIHSAPWSVGSQGSSNVSHGCVNASPENAKWFFEFTNRGDIIEVTGTSQELELGNGPTPWVVSWKEWLEGSALGRSVGGTPSPSPAGATAAPSTPGGAATA